MTAKNDDQSRNLPSVYLLVSTNAHYGNQQHDQDLGMYGQAVAECLFRRFGLTNVVIRSAHTPSDVLLSTVSSDTTASSLFVVLGSSTSSTCILETESHVPILNLYDPHTLKDPIDTAIRIAKSCSLASTWLREKVKYIVFEQRQAKLVLDAQLRTSSPKYKQSIGSCLDGATKNDGYYTVITGDHVAVDGRLRGKVRDRYFGANNLALVTTDRQSGFDRMLAMIPFKGAVLNLTSAFWFEQTRHIIPNHIISIPHPYVSIVKKCKPFPIEFVVRSYMTGSTSTSIWKNYQNGVRNYCGHALPEGMMKNQKLEQNLLTPTTKEEDHDRPISLGGIISEKWMTAEDLQVCADAALKVFALGQHVASEHGLILVDTKYEFGKDEETGEILLIDEVHTPDSSRYWLASTYEQRMLEGKEPDNIDKEFLRLWFADKCDPYKDEVLPEAPRDLVMELSRRYIQLYEMITWKHFDFESMKQGEDAITEAIKSNI